MPKSWARRAAATPRRHLRSPCPSPSRAPRTRELWDVEGRRYIDFAGGIAVVNTGHRHPRVVAAVAAAARAHGPRLLAGHLVRAVRRSLAERLNARVPGKPPKKTAFFSTGAEAVENAVQESRRAATGRPGRVSPSAAASNGRTLLALALTGKVGPTRPASGRSPATCIHAPFPDRALHGVSVDDSLRAIDHNLQVRARGRALRRGRRRAGPGRGRLPRRAPDFLEKLRLLCDRGGHPASSPTRCRPVSAAPASCSPSTRTGVDPDLVATAKSLAGGLPLSAVTGRAEIMDAPGPGGLGGNLRRQPIEPGRRRSPSSTCSRRSACPSAAARLGRALVERLEALRPTRAPAILEVCAGVGAMIAVELTDAEAARRVSSAARLDRRPPPPYLRRRGGNVIRFPLPADHRGAPLC
jgi:4-aminobutyrate aminotransferase-like enzyme